MKTLFISAFLVFVLLGCNQPNSGANKESDESVSDTVFAGIVDTTLVGIYQAVLPCPDCENRLHTVMLNADGSFRLEEEFIGKSLPPTISRGYWLRNNNTVALSASKKTYISYTLQNDTLKLSEAKSDKKETVYFDLKKLPSNKHTAWQEKWKSGIDFFGVGTEPFWSVEIKNEGLLTLTFADRKAPIILTAPKPRDMGDSLVYEGNDSKGKLLRITIYSNFCNDGMSDFIYEQTVRVSFEGMLLQGCGRFRE